MINNYAKNDLLPPPEKKKYSKEHVLTLIFIYYFKSILSISDIQSILNPITDRYFGKGSSEMSLEDIYKEVFGLEHQETLNIMKDLAKKFNTSMKTFEGMEGEDAELLRTFSFICMLSYDVYLKKTIIERIVDQMLFLFCFTLRLSLMQPFWQIPCHIRHSHNSKNGLHG